MSPDQQARAFDRFWRAPDAAAENAGFGLGLAIVRQLLSADGGTVELRTPVGGGLDVRVSLRAGHRSRAAAARDVAGDQPARPAVP